MTSDKETIFANLFAQLSSTLTGTATLSRKVRHYDQCQPQEQPAVFVEQASVANAGEGPKPGRQVVRANVLVYCWDDTDTGPMPAVNGLVAQVETALRATGGGQASGWTTTLSGSVSSTRVVSVEYGGGALGPQGVAVVGVEMITVG